MKKSILKSTPRKQFKFSGRVAPQDTLHQVTRAPLGAELGKHYIAPRTVKVEISHPKPETIGVPQYADPVVGGVATGFNPARDCQGYFMSSKFQPNNNCYAYGCNYASNTFPQPGRKHGWLLTESDFTKPFDELGKLVCCYAKKDELCFVGKTMAELKKFKSKQMKRQKLKGHFVALMISRAGDDNWPGDYHWARCDNSSGRCNSWSQKDGGDQVTSFDFAGEPISNPVRANWTVNQGPVPKGSPNAGQDQIVRYAFYCFMFVPRQEVDII